MPADLRVNTSFEADQRLRRIQQLQTRQAATQAALDAEIAALSSSAPTPSSYQPQNRVQKPHRRNSNVPRSMSSSGATMARHLSSDRIEAPSQRRTLSQRSAPPMARTNSKGTSSARSGNMPFTQTGAMPPPLRSEPRENPAMETWMKDPSYTFRSHPSAPLQRSPSERNYELEQVPELDQVGENPLDFLARTMGPPTLSLSPPFSTPPSTTLNDRLSTPSFNTATPSTPTTDSLTTATTLSSSMSRQNSLCNEPVLESFQMMKFNSNNSYSPDVNSSDQIMYDQFNSQFASSSHNRRSSNEEQSQLLVGAGASHDSQFSHSFSSAEAFASSGFGEKMEKSQSNESISSNSSSASRNKQRLQASLAAARPIMPKGGSDEDSLSRANSSQSMSRLESKDGSQDKVAISKPTYQRPKHERVLCKQCDNHPEGFRGEHELRRHQDREHKLLVKKWVCIEPSGHGHPKPELPLSKCKACGVQRKKYGAYYNAAAHLRRTHFKPKAKGARKTAKGDDGEKRGGKGGGDWPPMSELKYWMKEVEEPATDYSQSQSQQDEADVSDDETNESNFDDQVFQPSTLPPQLGSNNFNDTFIANSSPIQNMYPSTPNDMYSMQSMPLNLPLQQSSCIDTSMYSQNNFPNFSPDLSNDAMAFYDSVPQNFDDQVFAGPDFVPFPFSQ
ncbi:hypothetical protein LAWI1_G007130 [Lachnellula willkommii]|uniref:DUF7896 domain-containing protein n=1 Tax=Lachnellula willkommii TaxID=215461 RepID=A0A559M828_9HELO|nr:hypothetical protein LAWI1_G007130 [Lachnellula willkommii]